jgi:hypothetical protein
MLCNIKVHFLLSEAVAVGAHQFGLLLSSFDVIKLFNGQQTTACIQYINRWVSSRSVVKSIWAIKEHFVFNHRREAGGWFGVDENCSPLGFNPTYLHGNSPYTHCICYSLLTSSVSSLSSVLTSNSTKTALPQSRLTDLHTDRIQIHSRILQKSPLFPSSITHHPINHDHSSYPCISNILQTHLLRSKLLTHRTCPPLGMWSMWWGN